MVIATITRRAVMLPELNIEDYAIDCQPASATGVLFPFSMLRSFLTAGHQPEPLDDDTVSDEGARLNRRSAVR